MWIWMMRIFIMWFNIVANAFEEVISDVNNEKDSEANIIDEDYYQDYDDENQYAQQDDNISQETSATSTSVNQMVIIRE